MIRLANVGFKIAGILLTSQSTVPKMYQNHFSAIHGPSLVKTQSQIEDKKLIWTQKTQ